ncbi:response regulator [candidate division KSB1 bacterium]|nr:response regulator [candidate division KSB1 bacterium]
MKTRYNKILIADDEEDLSWSISKSLKRSDDLIEVQCVNRGDEALQLLKTTKFDLVISDIRMPGISGLELLDEIISKKLKISVILMTAYGTPEIERELKHKLSKTADLRYIEKPFDIHDLKRMVFDDDDAHEDEILPVHSHTVCSNAR